MLSATTLFNAVNLTLAVVSLLSILLIFKFVPDRRARILLIIAFILIILTGGVYSFCLKVSKMYELAFAGEMFGKAPPGSVKKVMFIRNIAQVGNVFEVAAAIIFVLVGKRFISLIGGGKTGGEA
ncbi:hypothetical protein HZA56_16180 [Candidatus Poribacteria bacterium]|nr:hypothetical protein [Candidatus Poribacteria bacterium]